MFHVIFGVYQFLVNFYGAYFTFVKKMRDSPREGSSSTTIFKGEENRDLNIVWALYRYRST